MGGIRRGGWWSGRLARLGVTAEVAIHIEKRLPVQGGMGAGSANAAAALLGLERELGVALAGGGAAEAGGGDWVGCAFVSVGWGGSWGWGGGSRWCRCRILPKTWCVVAVPQVGVSTPAAFKAWDALVAGNVLRLGD